MQDPKLAAFDVLVGEWTTEATHRLLPETTVRGEATFEWLEGEQFLIQRARNEHPDFPDSLSVIGPREEGLAMYYFDSRGVHRVYGTSLEDRVWKTWGPYPPGYEGRLIATVSDDGDTISCVAQLSQDEGSTWEDDLKLTYRRAGGQSSSSAA